MLVIKYSACDTGLLGLININNLNHITPIFTVAYNKSLCIGTVALLDTYINKQTEDLCYIKGGF